MPEVRFVPIDRITVGERFRKDYGKLDELAAAIKEKGVLQPITLDEDLNLQAGGRRLAACKILQLTEIPALIRKGDGELDLRECELMENVQRLDLSWQEKVTLTAQISKLYKEKHGRNWNDTKTADLLNRSKGGVSRHLQLAEALEVAPELAKCKTEDDAFKLLKQAQKHVVVRKLREEQEGRMAELPMVLHAKNHFRIGCALTGLQETIETYQEMGTKSNIGLFEVDPPYAIDLHDVRKQGVEGQKQSYEEIPADQYVEWVENLCDLLYKAAGRDCWVLFWFGPTWFTEVKGALDNAGFEVDDVPGIWVKGQGQTMQPAYHLANSYEPFFIARKGEPRIRREGAFNVFNYTPVSPANKWHMTQRPLGLIKDLLETFAMPGTVCCSPFLGSGTTIMAAYEAKMACFGWDLSQKHKDRFLVEIEEKYRGEVLDGQSIDSM